MSDRGDAWNSAKDNFIWARSGKVWDCVRNYFTTHSFNRLTSWSPIMDHFHPIFRCLWQTVLVEKSAARPKTLWRLGQPHGALVLWSLVTKFASFPEELEFWVAHRSHDLKKMTTTWYNLASELLRCDDTRMQSDVTLNKMAECKNKKGWGRWSSPLLPPLHSLSSLITNTALQSHIMYTSINM